MLKADLEAAMIPQREEKRDAGSETKQKIDNIYAEEITKLRAEKS